jgi:hypothetical protein
VTLACFDALYTQYAPLLEASTHIAVGIYLSDHPQRAHPMYAVLNEIQATLAHEQLSTLEQLESIVLARVEWQTLEPGVAEGLRLMIRAVRAALQAFLTNAQVTEPAHMRVVVRDVVDWTARAALISCPACVQRVLREDRL